MRQRSFGLIGALALSAALWGLLGAPAFADLPPERRVALVVGNGDYDTLSDLANAPSDAQLVADHLLETGYEVVTLFDADFAALSAGLSEMAARTDEYTIVVFYFAGHGLQVGAGNFLLPSDSRIEGLHDLPFAAMSLGHVMSILSARAKQALFILDSCRDNPFLNDLVVAGLENTPAPIEAGFYFQRSPIDTLLAFSTSPGELAFDGPEGGNSPYTSALVANAQSNPGADVGTIMARTRRDVQAATNGRQLPWESSSLTGVMTLGDVGQSRRVMSEVTSSGDSTARSSVAPAQEQEPASLLVDSQFEREINIGAEISAAVTTASVTLVSDPLGGNLAVVSDGATQVLRAGDLIALADLDSLVFRPRVTPFSAVGLESVTRSGAFAVSQNGRRLEVELSLRFDPCDLRAGGVLDPQGVGSEVHAHEMRPLFALAACEEAVATNPENGRFRAQLARALLASGDVEAARAELLKAIELGHIRAVQRMGILEITAQAQRDGMVQQAASERAVAFLEQGHNLGDPLADYTLGRELLRYGDGDAAQSRGYALLMRAHSAGYIEAVNELGRYFLQEASAHYNPDRALRYFEATAERGNINGQNSLGVIYRRGLGGVTADPEQAAEAYTAAAEGGHPNAPNALGILYEDGDGVPHDLAQALEWYDTGLERGDPWAGANGALMILRKSPEGTTEFDAATRAGRAAALGTSRASERAGELLGELDARALVGGAQALLNDLGADLVVDGAFGPASVRALREALGETAVGLTPAEPLDLLLGVASAHWQRFGFRIDLL